MGIFKKIAKTVGGGLIFSGTARNLLGDVTGANQAAKAANRAADLQSQAALAGIDETRRQFDFTQNLLSPYSQAGVGALQAQQNLLGLGPPGSQQQAISGLENSPLFTSLFQQGENSIMQNAAATGGLRGGNLQASLAQFRPGLLNSLIQQQLSNLGGITSTGLGAATGTGNAAQGTGANIANLLQQQGAAQAGGVLAAGQRQGNIFNSALGIGSAIFGLGGF